MQQQNLARAEIVAFRRLVYKHYKNQGRHDLPWRQTSDPYRIAVSEIMLQQTQVPRVIEKYRAFLKQFPTVRKLAMAPLSQVLALWSGLGYNRRAKFLKEMAQTVVVHHKGVFPRTETALEMLPGIGHYTARAICAFAYNQPVVFIETNIRTVYIHHFFADAVQVSDRELLPLVTATLDKAYPARWYAALMDYGSALKQQGNIVHRKSKHYVRQSAFSGSVRELRGAIIRLLLISPATHRSLAMSTKRTGTEVREALHSLIREHIIEQHGERYALANH